MVVCYCMYFFFFFEGDCIFEKGKCIWINFLNVVDDEFDWIRRSGSILSLFMGFSMDYIIGILNG